MLDGNNYPGKYIKYLNYEIESGISLLGRFFSSGTGGEK